MDEVKMDGLEASFEVMERAGLPPVRPMLAGGSPSGAMFEGFLRSGSGGVEIKAMSGASDAAGGYAVPESIDAQIDATLKSISPIRAIANVVRVGANGYRKLVTSGGTPSGWAAETGARAETDTPVFNEVAPPMRGRLGRCLRWSSGLRRGGWRWARWWPCSGIVCARCPRG